MLSKTRTSEESDYNQLKSLMARVKDDRDTYKPTHILNTVTPALPLLYRALPSVAAVSTLELYLWACEQLGDYNKIHEVATSVQKLNLRSVPSDFHNRISYLLGGTQCDNTELGRAAAWLMSAVKAIERSDLNHSVFRCRHSEAYRNIMLVLRHFPLGDTFTLQRLIMNLTNKELRDIAKLQATYSVGASGPAACWRPTNVRTRPRVVFTGEDFNGRPTGLLIRRFIDYPPNDMDIFIIQIGSSTPTNNAYSFRAAHIEYFEVSTAEKARDILERYRFDAIIDTKGLMFKNHCSLLSPRRAPLQVHWLAYPGTLGIPQLDYIIGDPVVTPRDDRRHALERVIRLPECYQINDDTFRFKQSTGSHKMSRRPGRLLAACVNMNYKVCPDTVRAWIQILSRCPHVDFAIVCRSPIAIENLTNALTSNGISPGRVQAHLGQPRGQFMVNTKQEVDLVLDPFRCPGHTTASDSYTAGAPVVSLYTDTYHGSVAHSLAKTIGLDQELTATSPQEYIHKAVTILSNPDKLAALRDEIAFQRRWSTLYDPCRYMTQFWDGLRIALRRCRDGEDADRDINVRPQSRFLDPIVIAHSRFTVSDNTNRAVCRLLFDGQPVIISAWHGEVWAGKKRITTTFKPHDRTQRPSDVRGTGMGMQITKSPKGTAILHGATPVLLGIPYPSAVRHEEGTVVQASPKDCDMTE